ncbi:hypothetical protein LCM20_13115 [Halobacillus litoralis]|uniref:hypothetical protein n=1 Tax=Halobacillus litoralis TaxID=45668 RepID=UPI001CD515BE|nr:hypothetical protein [Halobacillus litoralis]MCA0971540.1 hypothetical protein [Halobacillus litoralis]
MLKAPVGPLSGPLKEYEKDIESIITDLTVVGKKEEFLEIGREGVYQVEDIIHSDLPKNEMKTKVYNHIRQKIIAAICGEEE